MTEPPSSHISSLISFFLSLVETSLLGRIMSPLVFLVAKTPWNFEEDQTQGKNLTFYLNFFYEILWFFLFNDYYGEYFMSFGE